MLVLIPAPEVGVGCVEGSMCLAMYVINTLYFHSVGTGISIYSDIDVSNLILSSSVITRVKYTPFKLETDRIDNQVVHEFIDKFYESVMSQVQDGIVVKVVTKVEFSGTFRNFGKLVRITNDIKFKRILYNVIAGQMELNSNHYDQLLPTSFICVYIILDQDSSKILLPDTLLRIDTGLLTHPIDLPLPHEFHNLPDKDKKLFNPNGSIKINDFGFLPLNMDLSK